MNSDFGEIIYGLLAIFLLSFIAIQHSKAEAPMEERIWMGCASKAEAVYNIGQESYYGEKGSVDDLMAYLQKHMPQAQYEVSKRMYRNLGEYVDIYKAHAPASKTPVKTMTRDFFYSCIMESYKYFDIEPTQQKVVQYTQNFEALMDKQAENSYRKDFI